MPLPVSLQFLLLLAAAGLNVVLHLDPDKNLMLPSMDLFLRQLLPRIFDLLHHLVEPLHTNIIEPTPLLLSTVLIRAQGRALLPLLFRLALVVPLDRLVSFVAGRLDALVRPLRAVALMHDDDEGLHDGIADHEVGCILVHDVGHAEPTSQTVRPILHPNCSFDQHLVVETAQLEVLASSKRTLEHLVHSWKRLVVLSPPPMPILLEGGNLVVPLTVDARLDIFSARLDKGRKQLRWNLSCASRLISKLHPFPQLFAHLETSKVEHNCLSEERMDCKCKRNNKANETKSRAFLS